MPTPVVHTQSRRDVFSSGYVLSTWGGILPHWFDDGALDFVISRDRSGQPYCEVDERLAWGPNYKMGRPRLSPKRIIAASDSNVLNFPSAPKHEPMFVEQTDVAPRKVENIAPVREWAPATQEQKLAAYANAIMKNYARCGVPCSFERAMALAIANP